MQKNILQLEKRISPWLALIVWPSCLTIALCREGLFQYNFTGLLNDVPLHLFYRIMAAIILLWLAGTMYRISLPHGRNVLYAFGITAFLAISTPYLHGADLLTNLHLVFSFAAFLFFNASLFSFLQYHRNLLFAYFASLMTAVLLVLTAGAVTGIAELVYVDATSIVLGLFLLHA